MLGVLDIMSVRLTGIGRAGGRPPIARTNITRKLINIPAHSDPNFETNIPLNQVTVHICTSGKQMSDVTSKMALG